MSVFLYAENAARRLNAGRLPAFACKTQNNIFEPDSENRLNGTIVIAKESLQSTQRYSTEDNILTEGKGR